MDHHSPGRFEETRIFLGHLPPSAHRVYARPSNLHTLTNHPTGVLEGAPSRSLAWLDGDGAGSESPSVVTLVMLALASTLRNRLASGLVGTLEDNESVKDSTGGNDGRQLTLFEVAPFFLPVFRGSSGLRPLMNYVSFVACLETPASVTVKDEGRREKTHRLRIMKCRILLLQFFVLLRQEGSAEFHNLEDIWRYEGQRCYHRLSRSHYVP